MARPTRVHAGHQPVAQSRDRALLLHEHITKVSADKGTGAVSSRTWEQATAADRLAAKLGSTSASTRSAEHDSWHWPARHR